MNSHCVSNDVTEFLLEDSGQVAFELLKVDTGNGKGEVICLAIAVLRCLSDQSEFLISSFQDFEVTNPKSKNPSITFKPNPVEELLELLDLSLNDIPILDRAHIGPLSANKTMELIELIHGNFQLAQAAEKLDRAKKAFLRPETASDIEQQLQSATIFEFPGGKNP